jgi:hypothetical protein
MHHTPPTAVGRQGGLIHRNGRGAPTKSRRIAAKGMDVRLPLFLLAYRASAHDSTGLTSTNLVFGRELRLPCDLLLAPLDWE